MNRFLSAIVCLILVLPCMAQRVSNARFVQDGKTIKIYYDLSEKADVSIFLSTDGGQTFDASPLINVIGAVGNHVSAGRNKMAIWNVIGSQERLQGDKVCFKVRATRPGSTQIITVGGVSFTMVNVVGGTFTMGCTDEHDGECDTDEKPTHRVTLSDYYIGETEVTQQLWQAVMGSNPSYNKGEQLPVEQVTWYDCQEFVRRLNSKTGLRFALPTESQWEYAARGGSKCRGYKYSGSNSIDDVAWYRNNSGNQAHNVKGKQHNELGLYDMSGNVWEWCADWYGDYSSYSQTNPVGPSSGQDRVLRGGDKSDDAWICRVSTRGNLEPSHSGGLRLVLLPNKICFKVDADYQGGNRKSKLDSVSFTMVYVAGGTFTMGCTSEQGGDCDSDEKPTHQVTLSDYYIGETEVTQQLWQAVMGSNPSYFKGEQRPVENVSWDDCQEFISRLNSKTGLHFALPSEAQWEYAARGGSRSCGYKYSGSNSIGNVAWYETNSGIQTHNVKEKYPNELDLYDMSGNVYEWCNGWDDDYLMLFQDEIYDLSGMNDVLRGGGWSDISRFCRVSHRYYDDQYSRFNHVGFRIVLHP